MSLTSNELNEILNKTRRTENISLTVEQIKELINDLEVLEILKEAYCHAIWELYKYKDNYYIQDGSDGYRDMEITKEQYDLINQWVEEQLDDKS